MEPQPPAEEEEQTPTPESAGPAPDVPSPMDMVKRYALPVVFVLAVFSMYFKSGPDDGLGEGGNISGLIGQVMGTSFEVQVIAHMDPNAEELLWQTVNTAMESVDESMSTYKSESELSLLNAYVEPEPLEVSPDLMLLLQASSELSLASNGAFDATVGPLVDRWGFGPEQNQSPPTEPEIQALLAAVGADKLVLDPANYTVLKRSGTVELNLNAIAKGHAVDRVAEGIQSLGYTSWYVEIGGEVRTGGNNSEGIPWQLAIESPVLGQRQEMLRLPMVNIALATSGDYRNQREVEGKIISHTIDPRTGHPIDHGLASVSVLHPSCMWADGWATALNVLGAEEGLALAESQGLRALFVQREADGSLVQSSSSAWDTYMTEHAPESEDGLD